MKITLALAAALAATLGTAAAQSGNAPPASAKSNQKSGTGTKSNAPNVGKDAFVRSGGQGHNSGPDPKGKTGMAPTTPTKKSSSSGATSPKTGSY